MGLRCLSRRKYEGICTTFLKSYFVYNLISIRNHGKNSDNMSIKQILLLGNPALHEISMPCKKSDLPKLKEIVNDLHDTLLAFKNQNGFGRAIAAPQIGEKKRLIYMFIDKPYIFINPVLIPNGLDMITLWDDCMSFPNLLVKVQRYKKCKLEYTDIDWQTHTIELENSISELMQHEYDHLNGILAIHHAIDKTSFALASERNKLVL